MKRTKFLASLITIPTLGMSIIPLASCKTNAEQITLNFSGSDGVTLSGKTSIKVNKGKTWKELTKEGVIPEAHYSEGCESYGWYLIENGKYIKITDDYVPTDNTTAWFIAVDYVKNKINVKINYIPDDGSYWEKDFDFVRNGSFNLFKQYYHIPDVPGLEGHTFVQWQRAGNPIYDDFEFYDSEFPEKNNFTITAKFVKNDYTFNLSVNNPERGSVNVESYSCPYKTKFYDLVKEEKIKATAKDGYTFIKWIDELGNEVTQDYQILGNCALTAVFEPIEAKEIKFAKTAGVTFKIGGVEKEQPDPIYVQKGTKWNNLVQDKKIPDVECAEKYAPLGWYAVYEDGTYEYINEEEGTYEVKGPFTAKYVAYNVETGLVPISLKIDPDAESSTLYFAKNRTFQEFRSYYSIPENPTKGGYTFAGWYAKKTPASQEESIDNDWKLPDQDETVEIYAKFNPVIRTITIAESEHGTASVSSIQVNNGITFKDAVKDVTLTPESSEYEFDRWVDTSGNEIKDYYPITANITIKPIFVSRKIYISEVADTTREYREFASREALLDLQYLTTNQYSSGSSYWNKSFANSTLTFQTKEKSNDFKFLYEALKISVPVKSGTVTTKIKAKINWHIWSNGHFSGSEGDTSIQFFNLENATDHPTFFTNYTSEYTKAQDERCFYYQNPHFQRGSFSSWEEDRDFETIIEFTDTNDTGSMQYFDHYLGISFLIDVTKYADVSFRMNVTFERVE